MKIYAPSYYKDFKCLANECKHNCCIGWEIDIDDATMERYLSIEGEMGAKFRDSIDTSETPHFRLLENERCPFLNNNNLCDIISTLGEDNLCQICSDHPRFKNFFCERTEVGLGLSCEAACELILNYKKDFTLVEIGETKDTPVFDSAELELFSIRQNMFNILNNKNLSLNVKIKEILNLCAVELPNIDSNFWADEYLKLERLDNEWDIYLENLKNSNIDLSNYDFGKMESSFKNLLCYFIFRHITEIFDLKEKLLFCILSVYIIHAIYSLKGNLNEIARMYSSEIEYSDVNTDRILMLLSSSI